MLKANKLELKPEGWVLAYQWDDFTNTEMTDARTFSSKPAAYAYWATMCHHYILQRFDQIYLVCKETGKNRPAWCDELVDLDFMPMAEKVIERHVEFDFSDQTEEFQQWFKTTIENAVSAAKELKAICKNYGFKKPKNLYETSQKIK